MPRHLLPFHRLPVLAKTPVLIALGAYLAGGHFQFSTVGATMTAATLLWALLYAVNEAADLTIEQHIPVRRVVVPLLLGAVGALCAASAFCLSLPLAGLLLLMAAGQCAYSLPPWRIKRWWWAILLLSGVVNPILRLQCGAIWGTRAVPAPVYAALISLHLGGALRTRGLQRARDRRLGYHIAPQGAETAGQACTVIGLVGASCLSVQGVLPRLFLIGAAVGGGFAAYAWSGRVAAVARLRQGWLWFAVLSLFALGVLCGKR